MTKRNWIFIRGLGRGAECWEPFATHFQGHRPQDKIELLDVRGNGKLSYSPSYLTVADNVRDLRGRSEFIKKGEKVSLMTISLGSMIGVEWARLFPDEVSELVLMNTSDASSGHPLQRLRPKNLKGFLSIGRTLNNPDHDQGKFAREKIILEMTTNRLNAMDARAKLQATWPETSLLNMGKQLAAAATYHFPEKLQPKTLLLYCTQDHFVNPICSKRIAKKWNLNPEIHPTAGHDLPLEEPDWVIQKISAWLK